MSLITFRDRNSNGDPTGPTWYLQFDAATVEEYTRTANITTYPVETGAVLSDHYQPQPRQISLAGVVTDTPSGPWTNLETMQNAAEPPVMVKAPLQLTPRPDPRRTTAHGILRPIATGPLPSQRLIRANIERARTYTPSIPATTYQVAPGTRDRQFSRIASFLSVLDALIEIRSPVSVVLLTGVEYVDMMITDMRAPRISGSGGSVTFALDLQQIIKAQPATSRASEQRDNPAFQKKKPKGRGGTKRPSKDDIARARLDQGLTQFFPVP